MYMISYSLKLENLSGYENYVAPPKKAEQKLSSALIIRERRYHIEYHDHFEIICPEYVFKNGESIIVIPYFLYPGRWYPIQVYLHAISLYSSNPSLGQRGVAETTRIEFGLETFSHSTLCRTFKDLEESLKNSLRKNFGEEFKWDSDDIVHCDDDISEIKSTVSDEGDLVDGTEQQPTNSRRFPSVEDTAARRTKMSKILRGFHKYIKKGKVDIVGQNFVKAWYDRTKRLLI